MIYLLICLTGLPFVYSGSKCKPRADIHPCICLDRPIGKNKFDTTVICHGLEDGSSILTVEPTLGEMQINTFLLYDSYWSKELKKRAETDKLVPLNYISSFKMEEIKVVDTDMSHFACAKEYNCRTNYVKRFTAINTTMPDSSPCENGVFNINLWISCPGVLEKLILDQAFKDLMNLKSDFFSEPMPKLKALHMPRNHIQRIDRRAFSLSKFPALETLDLSHNALRDSKSLFSAMLKLKHLDLSYNSLKSIVDFQFLPHLLTLNLENNHISSLTINEWLSPPAKLRLLDLTGNSLICGCGITFVNSTVPVNAVVLGYCGTDSETVVKGKTLRKASRFLLERCNEKGEVGEKKPKVKKTDG